MVLQMDPSELEMHLRALEPVGGMSAVSSAAAAAAAAAAASTSASATAASAHSTAHNTAHITARITCPFQPARSKNFLGFSLQ